MNHVAINPVVYSKEEQLGAHCHEQTQLTMVVFGAMGEMAQDQEQIYGPLDIVVKPAGTVHSNEFGDRGTQTLQFSLNPEWLFEFPELNELGRYRSFHCPALTRTMLGLFRQLKQNSDLTRNDCEKIFYRLRQGISEAIQPTNQTNRPRWLEHVANRINSESCNSLTVKQVSDDVDKHRVSVARAFRQHYGKSIKQIQQQIRVKRAAQLLTDSDKQLANVSIDCGFSDQSHLTRVFKSYTGLTPNQFRQLAH